MQIGRVNRYPLSKHSLYVTSALFMLSVVSASDAHNFAPKADKPDIPSINSCNTAVYVIYFQSGSKSLSKHAKNTISEIGSQFHKCAGQPKIGIEAFDDGGRTKIKSVYLTQDRAKKVSFMLQKYGIVSDSITTVVYGQNEFAVPEVNGKPNKLNRRVVVRFLYF